MSNCWIANSLVKKPEFSCFAPKVRVLPQEKFSRYFFFGPVEVDAARILRHAL